MSFLSSAAVGFGVGTINGVVWLLGTRWWLQKRGILLVFKLGILALVIWFLLSKWELDPAGFLAGFSIPLILLLGRLYKWN